MRELITPADIEHRIMDLIEQDSVNVEKVAEAARKEAETDVTYKIAYAKAVLASTGKSQAMRESEAIISCATQLLHKRIASSILLAAREARDHNRLEMDGLRTLAANLREVTKPF